MNVSQASVSSIACHSECLLPGTLGLSVLLLSGCLLLGTWGLLSLSPTAIQYSTWLTVGAQ